MRTSELTADVLTAADVCDHSFWNLVPKKKYEDGGLRRQYF